MEQTAWQSHTINEGEDSLYQANPSLLEHAVGQALRHGKTTRRKWCESVAPESLNVPNRLTVGTKVVPRDEFDRIAHNNSDSKVIEKTIYVVKPLLVPHGTL